MRGNFRCQITFKGVIELGRTVSTVDFAPLYSNEIQHAPKPKDQKRCRAIFACGTKASKHDLSKTYLSRSKTKNMPTCLYVFAVEPLSLQRLMALGVLTGVNHGFFEEETLA